MNLNGPSFGDRVLSIVTQQWKGNAFCYDRIVARNMR